MAARDITGVEMSGNYHYIKETGSYHYIKKTGSLIKSPSEGRLGRWRRRWCMLVDLVKPEPVTGTPARQVRLEYYTKNPKTMKEKQDRKMKGAIDLRSCIAVVNHEKKMKGYSHVFNLVMANLSVYHLAASSDQERREWVAAMNEFIFTKPMQRQNYFADNSNLSRSIYVSSTYYDSQTLEEAIADHTTTQGAREQQHQQVASQPSSNTLSSADQTECGGESESETPEYLKLRGDDDAWLEGDALSMVLTSGCCKLPSPEHLETDQCPNNYGGAHDDVTNSHEGNPLVHSILDSCYEPVNPPPIPSTTLSKTAAASNTAPSKTAAFATASSNTAPFKTAALDRAASKKAAFNTAPSKIAPSNMIPPEVAATKTASSNTAPFKTAALNRAASKNAAFNTAPSKIAPSNMTPPEVAAMKTASSNAAQSIVATTATSSTAASRTAIARTVSTAAASSVPVSKTASSYTTSSDPELEDSDTEYWNDPVSPDRVQLLIQGGSFSWNRNKSASLFELRPLEANKKTYKMKLPNVDHSALNTRWSLSSNEEEESERITRMRITLSKEDSRPAPSDHVQPPDHKNGTSSDLIGTKTTQTTSKALLEPRRLSVRRTVSNPTITSESPSDPLERAHRLGAKLGLSKSTEGLLQGCGSKDPAQWDHYYNMAAILAHMDSLRTHPEPRQVQESEGEDSTEESKRDVCSKDGHSADTGEKESSADNSKDVSSADNSLREKTCSVITKQRLRHSSYCPIQDKQLDSILEHSYYNLDFSGLRKAPLSKRSTIAFSETADNHSRNRPPSPPYPPPGEGDRQPLGPVYQKLIASTLEERDDYTKAGSGNGGSTDTEEHSYYNLPKLCRSFPENQFQSGHLSTAALRARQKKLSNALSLKEKKPMPPLPRPLPCVQKQPSSRHNRVPPVNSRRQTGKVHPSAAPVRHSRQKSERIGRVGPLPLPPTSPKPHPEHGRGKIRPSTSFDQRKWNGGRPEEREFRPISHRRWKSQREDKLVAMSPPLRWNPKEKVGTVKPSSPAVNMESIKTKLTRVLSVPSVQWRAHQPLPSSLPTPHKPVPSLPDPSSGRPAVPPHRYPATRSKHHHQSNHHQELEPRHKHPLKKVPSSTGNMKLSNGSQHLHRSVQKSISSDTLLSNGPRSAASGSKPLFPHRHINVVGSAAGSRGVAAVGHRGVHVRVGGRGGGRVPSAMLDDRSEEYEDMDGNWVWYSGKHMIYDK